MSQPAQTLGKYQIIREIARSNDIVYEAWEPDIGRRIALKELNFPAGLGDKQRQDRLDRFRREARAAGSLAHPNIVTVYEVGVADGRHYIAMEYLEGQNLRQRLDAEGFLPQEEAVRIMIEVLNALAYAHEKGVIHRDIKPDNIQLLPDGRVKITDFGIARLTFEPSLTVDGQIFGTPSYMSPEQVYGREIDARSDIFSCGAVLYEAISGRKPFQGDSVVSISHAILHIDPPDPPQASFPIQRILRIALDKSPSERFASAKAMATALREALEALARDPHLAPDTSLHTTPYPYGQQQMGSPYVYGPPASPNPQQPGQYSANPNSSPYGQPYGQTYSTGGQTSPAFPPPPYPPWWVNPPPPKPWLKPETAEFLRKTLFVILVGGAILTLAFAGVWAITTIVSKKQLEKSDEQTYKREQASRAIPDDVQSMTEEIERMERNTHAYQTDVYKSIVKKELAALYMQRGNLLASSDLSSALNDFKKAVELDPSNPEAASLAGWASHQAATRQGDPLYRVQLFQQSAMYYEMAAVVAWHDAAYRKKAAEAMNRLALECWAYGQTEAARSAYRKALLYAAPDSEEARTAQQGLQAISQ